MKQTAVEWLEQQLYKSSWDQMTHEERMNICCTAKLMEKEQISNAYVYGSAYGIDMEKGLNPINYFKEKYSNEQSK